MKNILYIIFGILGGTLGGMGMGGGTLLIPLLSMLGMEQHMTQAINLIVFIPMSVIALIIHIKNKLVEFYPLMIAPAIAAAVTGAFIAVRLKAETLRLYFGIFLIVLGAIYLIQGIVKKIIEYKNRPFKP